MTDETGSGSTYDDGVVAERPTGSGLLWFSAVVCLLLVAVLRGALGKDGDLLGFLVCIEAVFVVGAPLLFLRRRTEVGAGTVLLVLLGLAGLALQWLAVPVDIGDMFDPDSQERVPLHRMVGGADYPSGSVPAVWPVLSDVGVVLAIAAALGLYAAVARRLRRSPVSRRTGVVPADRARPRAHDGRPPRYRRRPEAVPPRIVVKRRR